MKERAAAIESMRSLIAEACAAQGPPSDVDKALGDFTVSIVQELVEACERTETRSQQRATKVLSGLLLSPEVALFSTALTDRFHRSNDAGRRLSILSELAQRTGCVPFLPALDRVQMRAALSFGRLVPQVTAPAVKARVHGEAAPYLWGAEEAELERTLAAKKQAGYQVNLNYVGEEVTGKDEAQRRIEVYESLVRRSDLKAVSVKLSGVDSQIDLVAFDATVERLEASVGRILKTSLLRSGGPPLVYLDMEAYRDLALSEALVHRLLRRTDLDPAHLGLAVQAYLPESTGLIDRLAQTSDLRVQRGGVPLRVRLVKGANLQMEAVEASQHRLELPIFGSKREVDANYKRSLRRLFVHCNEGRLQAGVGSHNLFDLIYAWLLVERMGLHASVQLEMLEGMAGAAGELIRQLCGGLLLYAPAVLDENFSAAVSYLVRRLDENTSEENFLRAAPFLGESDAAFEEQVIRFSESLLLSREPARSTFRTQDRERLSDQTVPSSRRSISLPFDNVADTDWTRAPNRQWIEDQKRKMQEVKPQVASLLRQAPSESNPGLSGSGFDPSRPEFDYALDLCSPDDIERAIEVAAQSDIAEFSFEVRARLALAVADGLERNRGELIAVMVADAGKRVDEADIEVSEAIDFARFYARRTEPDFLGAPRGVVTITPPWNFPLAIPLGGALAALVAGNAVLLKAAPETPWVAHLAVRICHQVGVPRDALQLILCRDEDASPLIVDPRVKAVVLTGATSTARSFLKMRPGLALFAETGGKNCAFVSAVADHEGAVSAIVRSAFFHAGQKCSALSVLILESEVFDDESFRRQLRDAVESLEVGSAWDPTSQVTPLIRPPEGPLREILSRGEDFGTWLVRPRVDPHNPRLVSPGVLWGIEPGSFPHRTEFFGPVLAVMRAQNFDHGMDLLNQSAYGLTAGLFSLDEREQEAFVQRAQAGNLYINRGITGAVVGRQPFGGRKDSSFGRGAKAGGEDYVAQLTLDSGSLPGGAGEERLEARKASYQRAFETHFSLLGRGTKVIGELNLTRYTPAPTLVVLSPAATVLDVESSLYARSLTRVELPVVVVTAEGADSIRAICDARGVPVEVLSPREILERALEAGAQRVRWVGPGDAEAFRIFGEAGVNLIADPVSDEGRRELLVYLLAQSVSFSAHRYGNTSLVSLSRIEDALDFWGTCVTGPAR